jgi:hypothetical protein
VSAATCAWTSAPRACSCARCARDELPSCASWTSSAIAVQRGEERPPLAESHLDRTLLLAAHRDELCHLALRLGELRACSLTDALKISTWPITSRRPTTRGSRIHLVEDVVEVFAPRISSSATSPSSFV